jgi:threonyl-tRNA synthetase
MLYNKDIRVKLDDRNEKVSYKMRESVVSKIPYTLVLGDKERDNNEISYRVHGSDKTITLSIDDFINLVDNEIENKKRKEN